MIEKIVRLSLQQRLLVFVLASTLFVAGLFATKRLSVDAFPEVTNIQVQIAAEAPSRSPEEVERFVTIPIELGMAGLPGLTEMRSLNRNGIAIITLVFTDKTEIYFARQLVTERLIEVASKMPLGVTPVLAPPSTGLGEIYQYVVKAKKGYEGKYDETELRTIQDWIVRRDLLRVEGIADVSSFGGKLKQYEIAIHPDKLNAFGVTIDDVFNAVDKNNQNKVFNFD